MLENVIEVRHHPERDKEDRRKRFPEGQHEGVDLMRESVFAENNARCERAERRREP
jgi:hypothetical protein